MSKSNQNFLQMQPLLFLGVLALLLAFPLTSATFAVTIFVDASVGASGDGLSAGAAKKTIAEGVIAATGGDSIQVAAGTYNEAVVLDKNDLNVTGGYPAGFAGARDVTANPTIIDGQKDLAFFRRPLETNDGVTGVVFDGFSLINGRVSDGGALFVGADSEATVSNCILQDCFADDDAGAFRLSSAAELTITDCLIDNCSALDQGAVHKPTDGGSTLTMRRCTVQNCFTLEDDGGVFKTAPESVLLIEDCVFTNNHAKEDGGILWQRGGDLDPDGANTSVFTNCVFDGNTQDNRYLFRLTIGSCALTNCTFVDNAASATDPFPGPMIVVDGGFIPENTPGGNGPNNEPVDITNCIFVGNTVKTDDPLIGYRDDATSVYTIGNNLFSNNTYTGGSTLIDPLSTDSALNPIPLVGSNGNIGPSADPLFVDAAGGDYSLQSGSPAIDAGSFVGAPSADLNGDPRPSGGGFDIGAFEFQSVAPPPPSLGVERWSLYK